MARYNSGKLYKYKKANDLFTKTIALWRQSFKKMTDQELQAFMEQIAEWSKDYR